MPGREAWLGCEVTSHRPPVVRRCQVEAGRPRSADRRRAILSLHRLFESHYGDRPVFASFNATGLYLAVAIRSGDRFPLEERLNTANRPEELADDIELMERVVRALEMLRRVFP